MSTKNPTLEETDPFLDSEQRPEEDVDNTVEETKKLSKKLFNGLGDSIREDQVCANIGNKTPEEKVPLTLGEIIRENQILSLKNPKVKLTKNKQRV